MVKEGDKAPDFTLDTTDGPLTLSALKDTPVVLYFYPKDDTTGCTAEAYQFRDAMPTFEVLGARVIGISPDSIASHHKFAAKLGLPFALAADSGHQVAEMYGVWVEKSMYGKKYMGVQRSTFVIDRTGVVGKVFEKVSVPGHEAEVAKALASLLGG